MPEYLKLKSLSDAKKIFWENLSQLHPVEEEIESRAALNRVTFGDILSTESLPPFTRSTVDGYAVIASSTHGASDALPVYLDLVGEVAMGAEAQIKLEGQQTALIHTGGMLPEGADAVVMMEQTQKTDGTSIEVLRPVSAGENIVLKGEDVKPGDVVIPAGTPMRPAEIGGLLGLGITSVKVAKKPRVAILSSGDEVIPPENAPMIGQVRDINSDSLASLVAEAGGSPQVFPIMPDDREKINATLKKAYRSADVVIVTAGSSASTRDMTAEVFDSLGKPGVLVHGINIKPGKPTILAVCDGKPLVGLPGNPVSALVIANLIVKPLIQRMLGLAHHRFQPVIEARLTVNLPSQAGRDEYFPVRIFRRQNHCTADPIFYKSNLIFSLVRADGMVHIPPEKTGVPAGETVEVILF